MEKPSIGNSAKVPMSETGTAMSGIKVARQPCRKMKTTKITRAMASKRVFTISFMPSVIASVVSSATVYWRPFGKSLDCSSKKARACFMVSTAFEPGSW